MTFLTVGTLETQRSTSVATIIAQVVVVSSSTGGSAVPTATDTSGTVARGNVHLLGMLAGAGLGAVLLL